MVQGSSKGAEVHCDRQGPTTAVVKGNREAVWLLDDDFGATLFPDPSSSQFSFTTGEGVSIGSEPTEMVDRKG